MMSDCSPDGTKQLIGRYRLGQKIVGARLDRLHGGRDIGIAGQKHDRQRQTEFAEAALQLRAAQTWYPDIKENAAWTLLIRQTIQQMLGRWIGCNFVTGFPQATCNGSPEGRIIIDDMNNA